MKVVIVEDEKDVRDFIKKALEKGLNEQFSQLEIEEYSAADDIREFYRDAIWILDGIVKGNFTGISALRFLNEQERKKVIFISGDAGMQKQAQDLGVGVLLPKPFGVEDLISAFKGLFKD